MKSFRAVVSNALVVTALIALTACDDWESGDDFNTSAGVGANINISGIYREETGLPLVDKFEVQEIIITQMGNSIEVQDNHTSYYTGTIGTFGVIPPGASDFNIAEYHYSAGAVMLQGQVAFNGQNRKTMKYAEFVGIIRAVAVDDVTGTTSTTTINVVSPGLTINTVTTTTFGINEGNARYILEGHWVEEGFPVSIRGFARASFGTFFISGTDTVAAGDPLSPPFSP